jgi:transposase
MSIPGISAITATSFTTTIEEPDNFGKSRSVDARIGLTTRRYQFGEVDYDGRTTDVATALCEGFSTKRWRSF